MFFVLLGVNAVIFEVRGTEWYSSCNDSLDEEKMDEGSVAAVPWEDQASLSSYC